MRDTERSAKEAENDKENDENIRCKLYTNIAIKYSIQTLLDLIRNNT